MIAMQHWCVFFIILVAAYEVTAVITNIPGVDPVRQQCSKGVDECPPYMYCHDRHPFQSHCYYCAFRELGNRTPLNKCNQYRSVLGRAIYESDGRAGTLPLCNADYLHQNSVNASCSGITKALDDDRRHKVYIYPNSKCHIKCADGYVPNFNQSFNAVCNKCTTVTNGCSWDVDFTEYNCTKIPEAAPFQAEAPYSRQTLIVALVMAAVVIVLAVVVLRKRVLKLARRNPLIRRSRSALPIGDGNQSDQPSPQTDLLGAGDRLPSVDSGYSDGQNPPAAQPHCNVINNADFPDNPQLIQNIKVDKLIVHADRIEQMNVTVPPTPASPLMPVESNSDPGIELDCPHRIDDYEHEIHHNVALNAPHLAQTPDFSSHQHLRKHILHSQPERDRTQDSGIVADASGAIPTPTDLLDSTEATRGDDSLYGSTYPLIPSTPDSSTDLPSMQTNIFATQDFCQPIPRPTFSASVNSIPVTGTLYPCRASPEGQSSLPDRHDSMFSMPSSFSNSTIDINTSGQSSLESVTPRDEIGPLTAHPPPDTADTSQPYCQWFDRERDEPLQTGRTHNRPRRQHGNECNGTDTTGEHTRPSNQPKPLRTNVPTGLNVTASHVGHVTYTRHRHVEASSSLQVAEVLQSVDSDIPVQVHAGRVDSIDSTCYDNVKVNTVPSGSHY